LRGLFVTGTDTGVGKTVLAAAIAAALRGDGVAVATLKPIMTGLDASCWTPARRGSTAHLRSCGLPAFSGRAFRNAGLKREH